MPVCVGSLLVLIALNDSSHILTFSLRSIMKLLDARLQAQTGAGPKLPSGQRGWTYLA